MPRAFDRKTPQADKNPLTNKLDYDDPFSQITEMAEAAGGQIHEFFSAIGKLFGLPTPQDVILGVVDGVEEIWDGVTGFIDSAGTVFARLVGGFVSALQIPTLDPSKILNLPALFSNVDAGFKGIFNGWWGGGGTGVAAEVTYTIEAIKDAVINGYNVVTFVADEVNWPVPAHAEAIGILTGGGKNGSQGSSSGGNGGNGGLHGSYHATPLDLTGITHLDVQVGTAGNITYIREANATPHTGAILIQSPLHGLVGSIATTLGLTPTNSTPGSGGNGGGNGGPAATDGENSGLAVGGNGAGGSSGGSGGAGGSVSAGSVVKCGGAGGGGGAFQDNLLFRGGPGGPGGYPGGAGGGGGASISQPGGNGGAGAPGVAWLLTR